jgi:hypothetical protein
MKAYNCPLSPNAVDVCPHRVFPVDELGLACGNLSSYCRKGAACKIVNFLDFGAFYDDVRPPNNALIKVKDNPRVGQYAFDSSAGTYTFNRDDALRCISTSFMENYDKC